MMNDEIMEQMGDCEQRDVEIVLKNGNKIKGFVDVYESRYDNDGEASICFAGDNGEMLIIEEGEIESIRIAEEK